MSSCVLSSWVMSPEFEVCKWAFLLPLPLCEASELGSVPTRAFPFTSRIVNSVFLRKVLWASSPMELGLRAGSSLRVAERRKERSELRNEFEQRSDSGAMSSLLYIWVISVMIVLLPLRNFLIGTFLIPKILQLSGMEPWYHQWRVPVHKPVVLCITTGHHIASLWDDRKRRGPLLTSIPPLSINHSLLV